MTTYRPGAFPDATGTDFAVWSGAAAMIDLCLFDETGTREIARHPMVRDDEGLFHLHVAGVGPGTRYGLRADGPYDPSAGLWFDPAKLLMDPCAVAIDRPYVLDPLLSAPRDAHADTAPLMPKAVVTALPEPVVPLPPQLSPGGLVYELNVRAFTMLHPDVPPDIRGTVAALAHPAIIAHLVKLGVSAVELMPVTAWIDERHLAPLGLRNAWGYNPVSFMALDPRLAPGGIGELRMATEALRQAGIGVILDVVYNHTGESDMEGPTLSLRGLDANAYFSRAADGTLINDTGTGNTLACDHPRTRELILAALRHFVRYAGVEGFRFDLAPILGRGGEGRAGEGFDPRAETLRAIEADPVLADRVLIAEPWDIGPGGYQLGRFSPRWLEWNDRFRDDVRRFWRGDAGMVGALATRLAGSSDMFRTDGARATRSINFIAAHDGMTLADLTAYAHKHNEANGEHNRDGHDENLSWNNGHEGGSDDPKILVRRTADISALLATLFLSRGTIMLTAGDEFGRSQRGNNNAYAQDNEITWIDWSRRDLALEALVARLSVLRREAGLDAAGFLDPPGGAGDTVEWLWTDWTPMTDQRWNDPANRRLAMVLRCDGRAERVAVLINGDRRAVAWKPVAGPGLGWCAYDPACEDPARPLTRPIRVAGRSVTILVERAT